MRKVMVTFKFTTEYEESNSFHKKYPSNAISYFIGVTQYCNSLEVTFPHTMLKLFRLRLEINLNI